MSTRYHNTNLLDADELDEIKQNYQKEIKKHHHLFQENKKLEEKMDNLEKDVSYLADIIIDTTKLINEINHYHVTESRISLSYLFVGMINIFVYLTIVYCIFFFMTGNYPISYQNTDQKWEFDPTIFEIKEIIWNQIILLQQKIYTSLF